MVNVFLYVDEVIIEAKISDDIASLKNALKGSLKMKKLRTTKFKLGMRSNMTSRPGS